MKKEIRRVLLSSMALAASVSLYAQHTSGVDWKGYDWMSYLDDDVLVSQLSLPGAHDAATAEGWASSSASSGKNNSTAQDVKVGVQYNNGVRVFDIRPSLSSNVLYNSHGITRLNKTIESLLDEMVAFLNEHPSEFFIFHMYHGGSSWSSNAATAFYNLLSKEKYAGRIAPFKNTLTVGEMRGKLLFLSREDASGSGKWPGGYLRGWDEHGYENNKGGYINVGGTNDYGYNNGAASLYMQDYANTSASGGVQSKMESIKRLLDFTTHHNVRQAGQAIWTFNFASGYSKTGAFGVSLSDGYRDNATYTNKCILDYLTADDYKPGPTGVVMMDFVCEETTTFNDNRYMTNGNNVYGQKVVDAIIDNNFRCTDEQLKRASFSNTLPITFSTTPDIKSCAQDGNVMPGKNELMPEHRGYAIWGDWNSDGLMDFYYSGDSGSHGWHTYPSLVTNLGGGNLTYSYENNGLPVGAYGLGSKTLDYDQDGNLDFLFFNIGSNDTWHWDYFTGDWCTTGELLLVRNNGNGTFSVIADPTLRNVGFNIGDNVEFDRGRKATILNVGDYDGDGYPDLVLQGEGSSAGRFVKVLHNRHGEGFDEVQKVASVSEGGVSFGDFNADGLLDIVTIGGGDSYEFRVFRGTGDATTPFVEITDAVAQACGFRNTRDFRNTYGAYESGILVFDYDQDGRQDIYINGTTQNGYNKMSYALINTTEAGADVFSFKYLSSGITPFSVSADRLFSIVDLNGDDCVDAVQQGWSSAGRDWTYAISNTNGSVNSYTSKLFGDGNNSGFGGVFTDAGNISFGDFNGDGRLDLACIGYTNRGENAEVFYNTTKNGQAVAPQEPSNVRATFSDEGNLVISWDAVTLAKSGGQAMYNLYIKNETTGQMRMLVPAIAASGKQKGYADFSAYFVSPDARPTYKVKGLDATADYTVGVQAVSYNYSASAFATAPVVEYGVPASAIGYDAETEKYYGTYYADYAWTIPAGVETYKVTNVDSEGVVTLVSLTENGAIPAETGVVIATDALAENIAIAKTASALSVSGNMLEGTTTATTVEQDGFIFYKLSYNDDETKIAFYWDAADGKTLAATPYKAYLKVPTSKAQSNGLSLRFGEDLTRISSTSEAASHTIPSTLCATRFGRQSTHRANPWATARSSISRVPTAARICVSISLMLSIHPPSTKLMLIN